MHELFKDGLLPEAVSRSDIGGRGSQQDSVWPLAGESWHPFQNGDYLLIVADGAGGHQGGQDASQLAVKVIKEFYPKCREEGKSVREALDDAIREAHEQIKDRQELEVDKQEMASTVVVLALGDEQLWIANVGDSRAYIYRQGNALEQLSKDHTLVQREVDRGHLSPQEAREHPLRNRLFQALGGNDELDIAFAEINQIQAHDRYLLCSDGLTDVLKDQQIESLLADPQASLEQVANQLMAQTLPKAKDNVSFILMQLTPPSATESAPPAKAASKWPYGWALLLLIVLILLVCGIIFVKYNRIINEYMHWQHGFNPLTTALPTQSPTFTATSPVAETVSESRTVTVTETATETVTETATQTATERERKRGTETATATETVTVTGALTAALTGTATAMATVTLIILPTSTETQLEVNTTKIADAATPLPPPTATPLPTATPPPTETPLPTAIPPPTVPPPPPPTPRPKIVEYRAGRAFQIVVFESIVGWGGNNRACSFVSIEERINFPYQNATIPVSKPQVEQQGNNIHVIFDADSSQAKNCNEPDLFQRVTYDQNQGVWVINNAQLRAEPYPVHPDPTIAQGAWVIPVIWR